MYQQVVIVFINEQGKKQNLDALQAYGIIKSSQGKIISVLFTKKDGTDRRMVCRTGVKKGVTGAGLKFNPLLKGLIPVWDMQAEGGKGGFRMINLYKVKEIKIEGQVITA